MKPLVCVFAHPDDEAFGPGGSIAYYARKRDVYIVCVTSGDADEQFTRHRSDTLADIRKEELLASAKILGVKGVDFLGFKDGSLCNNLYHKVADAIREKLLTYLPDTVMTFDMRGVSGHIDHVAVSLATSFVVTKLDFVKTLLYYCEHREMLSEVKDYFIFIPPGLKRGDADMVINVAPYWKTKLKAMRKHVSQKSDANWIIDILSKYPKEEYFLTMEKGK